MGANVQHPGAYIRLCHTSWHKSSWNRCRYHVQRRRHDEHVHDVTASLRSGYTKLA